MTAMTSSLSAAWAQDLPPPRPTPEPGTYEAWRDGYRGWAVSFRPWSHDPDLLAWWRPQIERFWQQFAGMGDVDHPDMWGFVILGDGNGNDAYEARWIAECMAAGDIVIPYLSAPVGGGFLRQGETEGQRYQAFAVFVAGAPPEGVEPVLRTNLARQWLTSFEIDEVVANYRAMYAFD